MLVKAKPNPPPLLLWLLNPNSVIHLAPIRIQALHEYAASGTLHDALNVFRLGHNFFIDVGDDEAGLYACSL